ncbi:MAG: hypothetical protein IKJ08_00240 [Alistipes sp.]|nr:hypothetical protein [Alistipes sp.]
MKKLFALAALVLGVVSCQQDQLWFNADANGEAAFTLNVALPEAVTRAACEDSALGGVTNIDMTKYDIRYILEVYNNDDSNATLRGTLAKERMVNYETDATSTSFSLRLIPGRDYRFVVWADFVEQNHNNAQDYSADRLYDTSNGLKQVTLDTDNWKAIDETRDAYTNYFDVDDFSSTSTVNFELTRPFAKLRVVTNDIKELYDTLMPKTAVVNYYNTKFYTSFNAFEQAVAGETTTVPELTVNLAEDTYANEANPKADASKGEMTLFADYFFGAEDNRVMFTLDVTDNTGQAIPTVTFNTNIPVKRNYLTTIYGPILTDANNVTVTINDAFANESNKAPYYQEIWDGKKSQEPKQDAEGNYIIEQPSELAWLADQVNGVTRAGGNDFKGNTFILNNDINLGGAPWTAIGATGKFMGTFDGCNHTIQGLNVRSNDKTPAGLFANCIGYIQNLTVIDAHVEGYSKLGVIVGDGQCSRIENCHVNGAKIVAKVLNGDLGGHVGGITGYLSADGIGYVKDCSVKNIEVNAYRDVAGVVGTATGSSKGTPIITGCSLANATIIADLRTPYGEVKAANAGNILGRTAKQGTFEDNTVGENVTVKVYVDSQEELDKTMDVAKEGVTIFFEETTFANDVASMNAAVENNESEELNLVVYDDVALDADSYFHIIESEKPATIDGGGKTFTSTLDSYSDVDHGEYGNITNMSFILSSKNGEKITLSNATFTGEMSFLSMGYWSLTTNNVYDTELNNVNVIDAEVIPMNNNATPAVVVYSKGTLNNCTITGTTAYTKDVPADLLAPYYVVYDLCVGHNAEAFVNGGHIGVIGLWNTAKLTIDNGAVVDVIKPHHGSVKSGKVTIKAGTTVDTIDFSRIADNKRGTVNFEIEDGATINNIVDANGNKYASIDDYKANNPM